MGADMRDAGVKSRPGVLGSLLAVLVLAGLLTVGLRAVGPLPPLGPLLNPLTGVWSVARQARPQAVSTAVIPTLDGPVEVHVDAHGVPHIRATTLLDAIRALGFMQASDRLLQLEIQTRATAGTLTELIGEGALPIDREQRRLGLAWSAERAWEALRDSSLDRALYEALADGINARIDTLDKSERPFEYHFLNREPQRWEPVHSLLLERRMAYTLSYDDVDLWRQRAVALVGEPAADALYPLDSPVQEPVQPSPGRTSQAPWPPVLPPPSLVDAALLRHADALLAAAPPPVALPDGMVLGSNNWAVAAERSASGNAILAGDPHLQLTLPSIWYEAHLVVETEGLDVRGVSIPGIPGIVIGFTPQVAWSVTNNAADVVDYYTEMVDDADTPSRYRIDGEWQPLESTQEQFFGPDGLLLEEYTQYYTHRGPLYLSQEGALSMRWLALEKGASPASFLDAALASDVDELMEAFANYAVPSQNFIMADVGGRIAIRSTGLFPIRPPLEGAGESTNPPSPEDGGDGRLIRDGSTSASDWLGYWPVARYPQAVDPDQGYLASANQQPLDPADDPAYLGSNWTSPWRALRINRLMREAPGPLSAEDLRTFQTDPGNEKALRFAPLFTAAADQALKAPASMLAAWDGTYLADAPEPLLFETAFSTLKRLLWDELRFESAPDRGLPRPPWPREAVVWALAQSDPTSPWWDREETPTVEQRDDILRAALASAWEELRDAHGEPELGGWAWQLHRHANVNHLARFPGLGRFNLKSEGAGPGNLNPSSGDGTHGASWRMVVELTKDGPQAYVTYPGGQSGNPASVHYDDRLPSWQQGQLAPATEAPRVGDLIHGHRLHLVPSQGVAGRGGGFGS
ncbi:MAG: penicillin acylase family protein [Pseudomonadota bacterium]